MIISEFLADQNRHFQHFIVNPLNRDCIVIDPFLPLKIKQLLTKNDLIVKGYLITHGHYDHINGLDVLLEEFPYPVYASSQLKLKIKTEVLEDGDDFIWGNEIWKVIYTLGHTLEDICLISQEGMITGDTLFAAGAGNCYNGGDPFLLAESIVKLKENLLDKNPQIYPGHEYLKNNLNFANSILPQDNQIATALTRWSIDPLSYKMIWKREKEHNLFLRCNETKLKTALGLQTTTSEEGSIIELRKRRDQW